MKITALSLLLTACALCIGAAPAYAQDDEEISTDVGLTEEEEAETEEDIETSKKKEANIPAWLAKLSNLPAAEREQYIKLFAIAKAALAQGDWVSCDAALTSCEFIFNANPNIHNLRVVCYIEQKRLDAATEEMEKARKLLPDDATTLVNMATLHMAKKDYRACITEMTEILDDPRHVISVEVRDILTFRVFLCHLMLGEQSAAEDLVSELSPLADTPLFYYSRAAICLYLRDPIGARADLQSAANIFSKSGLIVPYQRALLSCDMSEAKRD